MTQGRDSKEEALMAEEQVAREALVADAFVELVNQLAIGFDVVDLLTVLTSRCVELLDAAAAGLLLADGQGHLRVMAASSEEIRLLELFQVQNDQGPCLDCFAAGSTVSSGNLTTESRWPEFAAVSVAAGFVAVCAIPLRIGPRVLGALNLFMDRPTELTAAQVHLARALADVASIAIVQGELARRSELVQSQLEHALQSRIVIEQAKGMIAQRAATDMDDAFSRLRSFARRNNRQLTEVARSLAEGVLDVDQISAAGEIQQRSQRTRPAT